MHKARVFRGLSILAVSVFCWLIVLGMIAFAHAADVQISWMASDGATGYILEASVDNGQSWSLSVDTGLIAPINYTAGTVTLSLCYYAWTGLPDAGLVLIRVTAYNSFGQTINTSSGAWINKTWVSPPMPSGVGVN